MSLPPLGKGSRLLVAGCGFVGLRAARLLQEKGWHVTGLTKSATSADVLKSQEPFPVIACDINDRAALAAVVEAYGPFDAVLDAVSSGRGGAEAYRLAYLEGARSLLDVVKPQRFLFTSSTSVYAQVGGELVDEQSPAEPTRETGRILRETEELVLSQGGQVARLGGIYAPERWVLWQRFCDGEAVIEGDGSRFINQIHRDDAASALVFLLTETTTPGLFNVTDGQWPTLRSIYETFAQATQRPLPPFGPVNHERKRGWTHKRVVTDKLRALGWQPRFASIAQALPEARRHRQPSPPGSFLKK